MRSIALLAIGLLVVSTVPAPSQAQIADKQVVITEQSAPKFLNDEYALNGGRLPPETSMLVIEYSFKVTIPPVSVCVDTLTVHFEPPPAVSYAQFSLSPHAIAFPAEGEFGSSVSGLNGHEIHDLDTRLSVIFTRDAPAFKAQALTIKAWVEGGSGLLSGCNLRDSKAVSSTAMVAPDYYARIAASTQPWKGNTPEPILVSNYGNGPTRVSFAWESASDGWVPSASLLILESKAWSGPAAQNTGSVALNAQERPNDWTGFIRVQGKADAYCGGCQVDEVVLAP